MDPDCVLGCAAFATDALSGKWLEHDVFFAYDTASKTWYGIAGISLETHPGVYASS